MCARIKFIIPGCIIVYFYYFKRLRLSIFYYWSFGLKKIIHGFHYTHVQNIFLYEYINLCTEIIIYEIIRSPFLLKY